MTTTAPRFRPAAILGLVVFLVLTGTGLAHALWSATATHTTTVAAGKITIAVDGPGLAATNIDSTTWNGPTPLIVRNTSAVDLSTEVAFTTTGALDPHRVHLALWPRTGPSCPTTITTPPAAATTGTLAAPALPAGSTTAKAGGAIALCAATRLSGDLTGTAGKSLTATPVITTAYANTTWSATATGAAFTHTMASAPAPVSSITCQNLSNGRIRLSWPAVTGATSYQIDAPQRTRDVKTPTVDLTRADTGSAWWEYRTVTITAAGATGNSVAVPTRVGILLGTLTGACPHH